MSLRCIEAQKFHRVQLLSHIGTLYFLHTFQFDFTSFFHARQYFKYFHQSLYANRQRGFRARQVFLRVDPARHRFGDPLVL